MSDNPFPPHPDAPGNPDAPPKPAPSNPNMPAAETPIWEGRMSPKVFWPEWLLWLVVTIALAAGLVFFGGRGEDGSGLNPVVLWSVVGLAVVALIALLIKHAWQYYSLRYRLTTQRLFVEKGILHRVVDQTELLRVDDVQVTQNIFQRLVGIGTVYMLSPTDRTDDRILIKHIANPHGIAEHIRTQMRALRSKALHVEQI